MKKHLLFLPVIVFLASACSPTQTMTEQNKEVIQNNQQSQTPPSPVVQEVEDYNTQNYTYELKDKDGGEQELIRRNRKTGEQTIIINSIFLTLKKHLVKFAEPYNSTEVIFKSDIPDTDNPSGELYSFNTVSTKFVKMKLNSIYDGFFGGVALSPDQTKLVWVPNSKDESGKAQTMYLLDLISDKYTTLLTLSGNETFNAGGFAMSSYFDIKWSSNNLVRYSIANQSKKTNMDEANKNIIGYREVVVK